MEWRGEWGDTSPLWTPELRAELGPEFAEAAADDGAFWMSYKDMISYSGKMYVCEIRQAEMHPAAWTETRKRSYFVCDVASGDLRTDISRDVVISRLRVFWLCDDIGATVKQACHAAVATHQNVHRVCDARPKSTAD